ncbi:hypothetical protein FisN_9Lh106 [Fistulifera solaris]|uniref:Uncharacterized protein n=1 Tax=Fistulifera solaris TaxID=1519565 RepID=A0A1Z5KL26_FISSO|nr:hypothetical protein FisN_9Lh106 [Fistulifera solaris]|eukprot:GAX26835.1 hypothetical protein FisN_9Lh106 [Fistulifera solaris]
MSRKRKADNVPNQGRPNPFDHDEDSLHTIHHSEPARHPTPSRVDGLGSDSSSQVASSFAARLMRSDQMNTTQLQSILNQLLATHNVNVRSDLNHSHVRHQDRNWLSSIQNHALLPVTTTTMQSSLLPLLQMLRGHAGQRPGSGLIGTPSPQAPFPVATFNNIDPANILSTLQFLDRLLNLGHPTSTVPSLFTHNLPQLTSSATTLASNPTPNTNRQPVLASSRPDEEVRQNSVTATSPQTQTFITMYMSCDDQMLSAYQCLIRKQIELFAAGEEDTCTIGQGRNRRVQLGQVGVRCKHCRHVPQLAKTKGAVYFPFKKDNVYQACQNMAVVHLCDNCPNIPTSIRAELQRLAKEPKSTTGGGKRYWSEGVRVSGIVEDAEGRLQFGRRTS